MRKWIHRGVKWLLWLIVGVCAFYFGLLGGWSDAIDAAKTMEGIFLAFAGAAIFGTLFYCVRMALTRQPHQMRRFLNRRFDMIRRKGFWGEEREFIDEEMIKRWGHMGWGLLPLPSFNLSLSIDQLWSMGGLSSVSLIVIAGMIFGDSRACVRFIRELGIDQYKKEAEQDE